MTTETLTSLSAAFAAGLSAFLYAGGHGTLFAGLAVFNGLSALIVAIEAQR